MGISHQEIYQTMLKDYPDVLTAEQVSKILSVSTKTLYKLICNGSLSALKVGRAYRIPKITLMKEIKAFSSTSNLQNI